MFKVAILQKRSINEQIDKNIETIIMAMEEASEKHADMARIDKSEVTRGIFYRGSDVECQLLYVMGDMEADIRTHHIHIVKWNGTE